MLPPHISEYMKRFDPSVPWLVVGKGPSFDPCVAEKALADGWHICAINNSASELPAVDLIVANDPYPLLLMQPDQVGGMFAVAVPSGIHDQIPNSLTTVMLYATGVSTWRPHIHAYDMRLLRNYPDTPVLDVVNTSTESAIQILAHAGVRKIYFNGVDGGQPHHTAFEVRTDPVDLQCQFDHFRKFKFTWPDLEYRWLPEWTRLNSD